MSRLYLLRHAKAASTVPGVRDFDRPLEPVGQKNAGALGALLAVNGWIPDAVIASPSLRTRQTLDEVIKPFPFELRVEFNHAIYAEEWQHYFEIIRTAKNTQSLMIVGHNPMCEDLVHQLTGSGEKTAMRALLDGYSPCTLAVIDFPADLFKITPKSGYLEKLIVGAKL